MRCHNGAMEDVKMLADELLEAIECEAAVRRVGYVFIHQQLAYERKCEAAFDRVVALHARIGEHLASSYAFKGAEKDGSTHAP